MGGAVPAAGGPEGALAGIRVIDFTHMLAGPFATWVLGAFGADIVKVEHPDGDFTRAIEPRVGGTSIYFASVNRNKRSIALDLKSPAAREVAGRLAAGADILVENNRPGVMERLGLGYEALSARNPRLVYASISGFGQTGPLRDRPAFDMVIQAMSGMMSITGAEGGPPVRVGASLGDLGASLFAVAGILAALQERHRTGRGSWVDVAMLDSQLAILENAVARWFNTGVRPGPLGSRHPMVAPFQAFTTADEPIVVCVDTAAQWRRLCDAIGRPELIDDPRFAEGSARLGNHAALERELQAAFAARDRAAWLEILAAADVPSGPVNAVDEAMAMPQIAARGMISDLGGQGSGRFAAMPVRRADGADGDGGPAERRAPGLAEHAHEILAEVGYTEADIVRLRQAGAV
ncbi:MAG: CoA transferase [Alphaproteobacteria bacterium]|nr:CoA transferase [Alphaproteobacteria bacterium]